jgi:flagellar protein FlgJ
MSISVDSNYLSNASLYTDSTSSTSMDTSLSKDYSSASNDELMEVCKDFEAYFTEQIFNALQKMVPEEEDQSSTTKSTLSYFKDMLTQEYAESSADGEGLGIAQMLYEQMKRNYNL